MVANFESYIPYQIQASYPLRAGNLVAPLVDGKPAFRRICRAVDGARHSVWLTVTFLWPEFRLPDGRGTLFDLLDGAVDRGLDVRVIFWRHDPETAGVAKDHTFAGTRADHEMLAARGSRFLVRWDRAHAGFCQHQKSWLIDAGEATETAFVGGINLNPNSMASPGHGSEGENHDIYVELTGPAATDVHHNFAQRWNEASERRSDDGTWGAGGDLSFPTRLSGVRGDSRVQIQRTIHEGRYSDGRPSPEANPYDVAAGEGSIFAQYRAAIGAARRSIYIENQAIDVEAIATALVEALKRGVAVVVLAPAEPARGAFCDSIASLGRYGHFTLAAIAGRGVDGGRNDVYVHAKTMLIDDVWATIGSCNLHSYSLYGNGELNVSFWDPAVVRALRCELLTEHLGQDTDDLDDVAAFALYREVAQDNRRKRDAGDQGWQGLAFALDPTVLRR